MSLTVLKKSCLLFPSQKLRTFQYALLDSLGIKFKKRDAWKDDLIKVYLKRKYNMSMSDAAVVVKLFGSKVNEALLCTDLGMEVHKKKLTSKVDTPSPEVI